MPAYELIERAVSAIISLKEYLPKADEYIEKLTDFQYEIEDIAETVEQSAETDYDDPEAELDKIESRLDAIKKLEKKYGPDIQSVLEYRSRIAKQLDDMEFSDEKLSELKIELAKIEKESRLIADEITDLRKDAAGRLEDAITRELSFSTCRRCVSAFGSMKRTSSALMVRTTLNFSYPQIRESRLSR